MEFRWLTKEEQRTRAVESSSLSEVLALAQKLQAENEGLVSEEQVVEMGRELGVRPEHVREALRLRRRAAQPPQPRRSPADLAAEPNPVTRVVQAGLVGLGLGTLPLALAALAQSNCEPLAVCAFAAAFAAGWAARHPRLAGVAGSMVVPPVILAVTIYLSSIPMPGVRGEAFLLSLLSFCPLGAPVGRAAARTRRWVDRLADRERLSAPGQHP